MALRPWHTARMPTEFPDEPTERHLAPDPALMEAARARGRERWTTAGEPTAPPEQKPLGRQLRPRAAAIALIAALLALAGVAIVTVGSGSDDDSANYAQPTDHSYVPGLITPPEESPDESSGPSVTGMNPTLASSALGLIPPTTQQLASPPAGDGNRVPGGAKSLTAGPGCGNYSSVGVYRDGKKGWVDHGDGKCGSAFVSVPMSGDARRDDGSAYGMWTFAVSGNCDVSVYVPDGNLEEVGGNPTVYNVFDRDGVGGSPLASFAIKQVDKRGQWVSAGRFKASGNLTVQLLTRGQDWNNSGPTYAHHAAGAVKADCTA